MKSKKSGGYSPKKRRRLPLRVRPAHEGLKDVGLQRSMMVSELSIDQAGTRREGSSGPLCEGRLSGWPRYSIKHSRHTYHASEPRHMSFCSDRHSREHIDYAEDTL
jgi:hypothetical protein